MKFRHTHRGVIKFIFFGLITLGIYDIVVLHHARKEVNFLLRDHPEVKRQMPFFGALVLGLITLGIVPLVWLCRMSNKIALAGKERGVTSPKLSAGSFFCWSIFGALIIVGPFIAWHKFFKLLNLTERSQNVLTARAEEEEAAQNEGNSEEIAEENNGEVVALEEKREEAPAQVEEAQAESEEPAEEQKEPDSVKDPSLPYQYVTAEPVKKEVAEQEPQRVYRVTPRKEVSKWNVRTASGKSLKTFETEQDAIAYAKSLAARRGVSVRVKNKSSKKR